MSEEKLQQDCEMRVSMIFSAFPQYFAPSQSFSSSSSSLFLFLAFQHFRFHFSFIRCSWNRSSAFVNTWCVNTCILCFVLSLSRSLAHSHWIYSHSLCSQINKSCVYLIYGILLADAVSFSQHVIAHTQPPHLCYFINFISAYLECIMGGLK